MSLTVPNADKPEEIAAANAILADIAAGRVRSVVDYGLASLNIIDLRGLNLDLPPSTERTNVQRDPRDVKLELSIDKDGNKRIVPGDEVIKRGVSSTRPLLKAIESQLGRKPKVDDLRQITITIAPDESTWHEYVIQAVDDARGAKIEKFSIR